ncbi:MAG: TolC family protein, partial [Pirellulales bacterium]
LRAWGQDGSSLSGAFDQLAAGELTLDQLEQIAMANNPAIGQAAARVQAARGRWVQDGLYPNPVAGYVGSEIGNEGRGGQQGGFVSQEFVRGGKLRLNRAVAGQRIREAQQELAIARQRVLTDVRLQFYEVLFAQRTLEIAEQLLDIGEEGVKTAGDLLRIGDVSRFDLLQAQIERDSSAIQVSNARNRHAAAWRRLSAVTGAGELRPARLRGELEPRLPEFTWHESLSRLLAESPELAAAEARAAAARRVLQRARAEPIPNYQVEVSAQHDNASGDAIAGVEIGMALPVFNRNQGAIRQAQAEWVAACREVQRIELALQSRLASAFEQYSNARQQTRRYAESILPNARTSLDLVATGYRGGEFNYITLLTAQRTFFQTNVAYLDALAALRRGTIAIEGLLLSDSLAAGQ